MKIARPSFPCPVLCIDEFLDPADADEILAECVALDRVFVPGRIFDGQNASAVDERVRKNEVVYLDDVFRCAPERSSILRILKNKIWTDECRALWHDKGYIFDIINYSTWHELVLSRYGDGDFYDRHQDTRRDHITYRIVTLIYYVHQEASEFGGGSLTLWKEDQALTIEPCHNRAVLFPSFTFHQVDPVQMDGMPKENGRFSINFWIGFR